MAKADEKGFSLKRGVALLPRLLPHVGNVQAKESKGKAKQTSFPKDRSMPAETYPSLPYRFHKKVST